MVTPVDIGGLPGLQLCWTLPAVCVDARAEERGGGGVDSVEIYLQACPPETSDTPYAILPVETTCVQFTYAELNAVPWAGTFCIVVRATNGKVLVRCTWDECRTGSGSSSGTSTSTSTSTSSTSSPTSSPTSSGTSGTSPSTSGTSTSGTSGTSGTPPTPPTPPTPTSPSSPSSSGHGCRCLLTGTATVVDEMVYCSEGGTIDYALGIYLNGIDCDCESYPCNGNWRIGTAPGDGPIVYTGMGPLDMEYALPCGSTYGAPNLVYVTFEGTAGALTGVSCTFLITVYKWD